MPSSQRITSLALLLYVPLAVGALAWAWLGQERAAWSLATPWLSSSLPVRVAVSAGLGLALAAVVVGTTPWLVERTSWARALRDELRPLVEPLGSNDILVLALSSGISEELFFRGALQPVLGLLVTSLIFGAVHTGPRRVFVAWSIWAFVMGLAFGWIFEMTGVLLGPMLAHVLINQRNLTFMKRV